MRLITRAFALNFKNREIIWGKRIFAVFMLPIFVFQMTSVNLLLVNLAQAEESAPLASETTKEEAPSEKAEVVSKIEEVKTEETEAEELVPATAPQVTENVSEETKNDDSAEIIPVIEEVVATQPETESNTSADNLPVDDAGTAIEETAVVDQALVVLVSDPIVPVAEIVSELPEELPIWKVSDNGAKAVTNYPVKKDVKYLAPQNEKVTVTFTKLPDNPGTLTIKEIKLSPEKQAELGALSEIAYDITSTMENGSFEYNLTLPYPDKDGDGKPELKNGEEINASELKVNFSEDGQDFKEVQDESNVVKDKKILEIKGLNHFTIFVIFSDDFESGDFLAGGWYSTAPWWSVTSTAPYGGTYDAQFAGTVGRSWSGGEIRKNFETLGYSDITLSYWYKITEKLESADTLKVEWNDGSSWNVLKTYTNLSAGSWIKEDLNFPASADKRSSLYLRFVANFEGSYASDTGDKIEFDEIKISGTKDELNPSTSITLPHDGGTVKGNVAVSAEAFDFGGNGITKVELWSDTLGIKIGETAIAPYSFTWDTAGLAEGNHKIKTVAYNGLGNSSESEIVTVNIDNTAPVLTEITPVPTPTSDNTPEYTFWTTEIVNSYTFSGSCSVGNFGGFGPGEVTLDFGEISPLADGVYSDCRVTSTDQVGNVSEPLVISSFTVDTTVPTLTTYDISETIISPNADGIKDDSTISVTISEPTTLNIRIMDGSPVVVKNLFATMGDERVTSKSVVWDGTNNLGGVVPDGEYIVEIEAYDAAGNYVYEHSRKIVVDNTAPTGGLNSPADGDYLRGTFEMNGWRSDFGSGLQKIEYWYADVATKIGEDVVGSSAPVYWDTTQPGVGDGAHDLWVVVYDNAGNVFTSSPITVIVDNTAPTIGPLTLTNYSGDYMQSGVEMSAPATDANGIADCEFRYFHEDGWSDWVGGNWSSADEICYIGLGGMTDGEDYELQFRAEDSAGNYSDPISSGLKTIDGEKPYFTDWGITSYHKNGYINLLPDIWAKIKDNRTFIQSCQYGVKETSDSSFSWLDLVTYGTDEENCRADDIPGLADGKTYNFAFRGWDSVGNQSDDFIFSHDQFNAFTVDTTPPVTTASAQKTNKKNYVFGTLSDHNVIVTLAATDSGAGVDDDAPKYCVDQTNTCDPSGIAGIEYVSPFKLKTEGTNYVRFYSFDSVGNREAVQSKIVRIDRSENNDNNGDDNNDNEDGNNNAGGNAGGNSASGGTGNGNDEPGNENEQGENQGGGTIGGGGETKEITPSVLGTETEVDPEADQSSWWWWLIIILTVFSFFVWLWRRGREGDAEPQA